MAITTRAELKLAILQLEAKKIAQKNDLLLQLKQTKESLKPANLIKDAFHEFRSGPGLGSKVLNATIGIGAGLLSKRMMIGTSTNIFKKVIGSALELGVAGVVAKNGQEIKSRIGGLLKRFSGRSRGVENNLSK